MGCIDNKFAQDLMSRIERRIGNLTSTSMKIERDMLEMRRALEEATWGEERAEMLDEAIDIHEEEILHIGNEIDVLAKVAKLVDTNKCKVPTTEKELFKEAIIPGAEPSPKRKGKKKTAKERWEEKEAKLAELLGEHYKPEG